MDILLAANPKLLDKTDEDGVWITIFFTKFNIIQMNLTPICDDIYETTGFCSSWICKRISVNIQMVFQTLAL